MLAVTISDKKKERRQRISNFFPFYQSGFFISRTENKTIIWVAAPVLSKIIYLPALQKKPVCWQEKNKMSCGSRQASASFRRLPGTLPESREVAEGPLRPRVIHEEKVWKWRTVPSPSCPGGRPSGLQGTLGKGWRLPPPWEG